MATNSLSQSEFDSIFSDGPTQRESRNSVSTAEFDSIFSNRDVDQEISQLFGQSNEIAPGGQGDIDAQISQTFGQSNDISPSPALPGNQIPQQLPKARAVIQAPTTEQGEFEDRNTLISQAAPSLAETQRKDTGLGIVDSAKIKFTAAFGAETDEIVQTATEIPGVSDFTDSKGNQFLKFPSGQIVIVNRPGLSELDVAQSGTEVATSIAAALGPGKLLKGPGKALAGKLRNFLAQGASGGIAELGQAGIRKLAGTKESIGEIAGEVATGAVLEAAASPVGKLVQKAVDIPSKAIGKLFKGSPVDRLTGFGKKAIEDDSVKEAAKVFQGTQFSLKDAGKKIQGATEQVIAAKRKIRSQATSKVFTEAFSSANKAKKIVNVDSLLANLKTAKEKFGDEKILGKASPTKNVMDKVERLIKASASNTKTGSNLESLHKAKQELFEIEEALKKKKGGISRGLRRVIGDARNNLRDILVKNSDDYAKANADFAKLSPDVENAEQLFDQIGRIKKKDLGTVAKKIFSPGTAPETIKEMKKLMGEVDPGAFADLQRAHLQSELRPLFNKPAKEFLPAAFDKLFSGEKGRKADLLIESLSPQGRTAATNMRKLLNRLPNQGRGFFATVDRRLGIAVKKIADFDTPGEKLRASVVQTLLTDTRLSSSINNMAKNAKLSEKILNTRVNNVLAQAIELSIKSIQEEELLGE